MHYRAIVCTAIIPEKSLTLASLGEVSGRKAWSESEGRGTAASLSASPGTNRCASFDSDLRRAFPLLGLAGTYECPYKQMESHMIHMYKIEFCTAFLNTCHANQKQSLP